MNENTDVIFDKIQKHVVTKLRYRKKIDGIYIIKDFKDLNDFCNYLLNWALQRVCKWDLDLIDMDKKYITRLLEIKIVHIKYWIEHEYKNPEFMRRYNRKYYREVTKVRKNILDIKDANKIKAKATSDKNYNKVLETYTDLSKVNVKPTIMKIVELTSLNKNTVQKYLKVIKSKV